MEQTPALIQALLGCPLSQITQSYWAVKLDRGGDRSEWVSEARGTFDFRRGAYTPIDWMDDIAATDDCQHIVEIWLFCPPSRTAPVGNTARLPITRPRSAFQLKIGTHDAPLGAIGTQTLQAHLIGRIDDADGNCTCFAFDPVEGGLITPETCAIDPDTGLVMVNEDGTLYHPLRTNVRHFGWRLVHGKPARAMWRPSLAPLGQIAIDRLGATLS